MIYARVWALTATLLVSTSSAPLNDTATRDSNVVSANDVTGPDLGEAEWNCTMLDNCGDDENTTAIPTPAPTSSPERDPTDGSGVDQPTPLEKHSISLPISIGIHRKDYMTGPRATELHSFIADVTSIVLDDHRDLKVFQSLPGRRKLSPKRGRDDKPGQVDGDGNSGDKVTARLYFMHVKNVTGTTKLDNWHTITVQYAAFWENGNPVNNWESLQTVQEFTLDILNATLKGSNSVFWEELKKQDTDKKYVARRSVWKEESAAIGGVAMPGDEYPIALKFVDDMKSYRGGFGYTEQLPSTWMAREWFGLGLALLTILGTAALTVASSRMQRHYLATQTWGLTEQGVGEMLQVGWTYHQDPQNAQLFLSVYDKGQVGYNDENSLLQGGLQQNVASTHVTEQSATATTSTPQTPSNTP